VGVVVSKHYCKMSSIELCSRSATQPIRAQNNLAAQASFPPDAVWAPRDVLISLSPYPNLGIMGARTFAAAVLKIRSGELY